MKELANNAYPKANKKKARMYNIHVYMKANGSRINKVNGISVFVSIRTLYGDLKC